MYSVVEWFIVEGCRMVYITVFWNGVFYSAIEWCIV